MTRDSPSFKDELDIMKFICKDFWTKVFRRQVDNLRTNHQVQKKKRLEPKLQFRNASELKRNYNLSCTYSVCGQNSDPLGNWTFQWTIVEPAIKIHFNKLSVPEGANGFIIVAQIHNGLLISPFPQGTYVLQDNKFSLLTPLSSGKQYLDQAPKVSTLSYSCMDTIKWFPRCTFLLKE